MESAFKFWWRARRDSNPLPGFGNWRKWCTYTSLMLH